MNIKKKLHSDLVGLAHKILQLKEKDDVSALYVKAKEVYESLTVLHYASEILGDDANESSDKSRSLKQFEVDFEQKIKAAAESSEKTFSEKNLSELFMPETDQREEMDLPGIKTIHKMVDEFPNEPKEEKHPPKQKFKTELFDQSLADEPEFEKKTTANASEKLTVNQKESLKETKPKLNEQLLRGLSFGMNEKHGFIKQLFNGSEADFTRVVSQINTMEDASGALNFIREIVMPEYHWDADDASVKRFLKMIENHFKS